MDTSSNRTRIVLGALLIAAGVLALAGQVIGGSGFWPFIIILFGLAFFGAVALGGRSLSALAIPGSIITGIGLILLVQNTFGLWETWAYAWALIISFVGVGILVSGIFSGEKDLQRKGWEVIRAGLVLFLVFGIMMELIFSLTGVSGGRAGITWPVLLIVAGIVQLIVRSYRIIRGGETYRRNDYNLFWPVILIGIGILWLMTSLGMLTLSQLSVLLNLWPVLLVAAGVNLLLGRRLQWVNLLFGAAVVVGMFYAVINANQLGLTGRILWMVWGVNTERGAPITEWVTGSGVLASEKRAVTDFDRVSLNLIGEMEIVQGSQPGLVIEGEENLLPNIVSEVRGGELVIEAKRGVGFRPTKILRYRLTVSDLQAVTVSGAANVNVEKITTDSLSVTINGAGTFNLRGLETGSMDAAINGSGTINANGNASRLEMSVSGAGGFNGADLRTESARVEISGLGSATVWANQELTTSISGAGSISYYGSPNVHENTSGIGSVRKIGDK